MVAVHHKVGRVREFLDETGVGSGAVENRIDPLRADALLLHGAREQREFGVIARRNDEVRVQGADAQGDVRHVARGRRMGDGFENFEAALRQAFLKEFGEARAEQAVLMHDDDGLRGLAGRVVEPAQVFQRSRGDLAEAGAEAERVLEAAVDDLIGDADIADVGDFVARSGLRCGQHDRRGKAADDGGHALALHALDLGRAAFRI